jgi:hypothetical protein
MARPRRMPKKTEPWWLSDATETCPTCGQSYAYHTEVRCVDCDGPLCPICVQVTTTLEFSCPDCFERSEARPNDNLASEVSK